MIGLLRNLALALVAAIVALLVFEGVLALAGRDVPTRLLWPGERSGVERDATHDPRLGWKLPPNAVLREQTVDYEVTYRSNAEGFRGRRDFAVPTEEGVRRIVFLGDSYTFGSGVEDDETFAALYEQRVPGTRAYNLGIGGYGIDQMWLSLRHVGLPLSPDQVVLTFIRHDLDRSLTAYRSDHIWREKPMFRVEEGELVRATHEDQPHWMLSRLSRTRIGDLWRRTERSLGRRVAVGRRWRVNRALFAAIRDDCRALGVPLLVVHIPVNRRHPVPLFERVFADLGMNYLDLTPLLPPDADRLYFPNDHHLNPEGHRFVAATLEARLGSGGAVAPGEPVR